MTGLDERDVEALLTKCGLERLLPVRPAGRRLGCSIWDAWIRANVGDVSLQLHVYPLAAEPESIVDLEEDITALRDTGSERKLLHEIRDADWALLITCASADWKLAQKAFASDQGDKARIAYHPQLDRILGGDFFRDHEGHWIKYSLASVERAMTVPDLLRDAQSAYEATAPWPGKAEWPMPRLLAIVELPSGLADIDDAPEAYRRLAQMQFVIASPEVIQIKPPAGAAEREQFTQQLFGFLASQHKVGICCSRDAGCCIRPEFLLADGSLTDVYFLCRPDDSIRGTTADRDLWNGLLVTCELAGNDAVEIGRLLAIATEQYTGRNKLPRDVRQLIDSAAKGFANSDVRALEALLNVTLRPVARL